MHFPVFPVFGIALLLASCLRPDKGGGGVEDDVISVNPNRFDIELPVGEKRLVLREMSTTRSGGSISVLYALGIFEILKDTVFNGNGGKIVSSSGYELHRDTVRTFTERNLIVKEGGRANLYTFGTDYNGFSFGLLKRTAYDTAVFGDRMTVMEYPLFLNKEWKIRGSGEPHMPLRKEFVMLDTLDFDGMRMECHVFDLHSFADARSWVSRKGLLKAETDFGEWEEIDTLGYFIGIASSRERYELLKLNPSDQEIEAAMARYRAMTSRDYGP